VHAREEVSLKSDRLIILVTPEEKTRVVALAKARGTSVGGLVRSALSSLEDPSRGRSARAASARSGIEISTDGEDQPARLSAEQEAALERLADLALRAMQRANAALDQAFEEIEATKAHFAAKRREAAPA
jgi:hypothetical protein